MNGKHAFWVSTGHLLGPFPAAGTRRPSHLSTHNPKSGAWHFIPCFPQSCLTANWWQLVAGCRLRPPLPPHEQHKNLQTRVQISDQITLIQCLTLTVWIHPPTVYKPWSNEAVCFSTDILYFVFNIGSNEDGNSIFLEAGAGCQLRRGYSGSTLYLMQRKLMI